jgi:hypothetical protein
MVADDSHSRDLAGRSPDPSQNGGPSPSAGQVSWSTRQYCPGNTIRRWNVNGQWTGDLPDEDEKQAVVFKFVNTGGLPERDITQSKRLPGEWSKVMSCATTSQDRRPTRLVQDLPLKATLKRYSPALCLKSHRVWRTGVLEDVSSRFH